MESEAAPPATATALRPVVQSDVAIFFAHQLDPEGNRMAAFTADNPHDRASFFAMWAGIQSNPRVVARTIVAGDAVAGNIVHFLQYGLPAVGYWLGREYWGRGIASAALAEFLGVVTVRPLYARAASDNAGSLRVLEKAGFVAYSTERGWANARGREIEERVLILRR